MILFFGKFITSTVQGRKNEKYAFQGGEINFKKKNTDLVNMFPKKSKSCNVQSFTVCTVYHDAVS